MGRHSKRKVRPASPVMPSLAALRSLWAARGPVFKFLVKFSLSLILLNAVFLLPPCQRCLIGLSQFYAIVGSHALNRIGEESRQIGALITSIHYTLVISNDCSAYDLILFLWAVAFASPAALDRKLVGIVLGMALIFITNFLRVVTLFLVGVHRPGIFEAMHGTVWPALLVAVIVLFSIAWASWAIRANPGHVEA